MRNIYRYIEVQLDPQLYRSAFIRATAVYRLPLVQINILKLSLLVVLQTILLCFHLHVDISLIRSF